MKRIPDSRSATAPAPSWIRAIRRRLLDWYTTAARPLPWRASPDPYRVWISEIMAQQTRVEAAAPYFERWVARFPDVATLAAAPLDDVLKAWEGLGYYARARNLHRAAQVVREQHNGELPTVYDALRELPGVGDYTAGAIASIAFARAEPAVDGNVRRVLSRLRDADLDARALRTLAARLVPQQKPGDFNQALMELGARICTPRSPKCDVCPLATLCAARAAGTQHLRPAKKPKQQVPIHDVGTAILRAHDGRILFTRRPDTGLLAGMWEFPGALAANGESLAEVALCAARAALARAGSKAAPQPASAEPLTTVEHTFSHRIERYHAFEFAALRARTEDTPATRWRSADDVGTMALPTGQRRILRALGAAAFACATLAASCANSADDPHTILVDHDQAPLQFTLPQSPTILSRQTTNAVVLERNLVLGGAKEEFEEIADVKANARGLVVLDRRAANLIQFDHAGNELWRVGREGEGPGEFKAAAALVALPSAFVIWDIASPSAFTMLDTIGSLISTARPPVEGDWGTIRFRSPKVVEDGYQQGPSDITRRLQPFGDSLFVHENRAREPEGSDGFDAMPTHLIAYDLTGQPVDTLFELSGTATMTDPNTPAHFRRQYLEPFFAARPLWETLADGSIALTHGDSTSLVVLHGADTTAVVRWPPDRLATTGDDRMANTNWEIGVQLWDDPEWAETWQSLPWFMRNRVKKQYLREHAADYAEQQPHIAALYTGGACLFLAGSNPSDNIIGTALTWIVLNAKTGDHAVIRLPRPGLRVRDVTAHHIYTTHRDADGVWFIERYPLRGIDCDAH